MIQGNQAVGIDFGTTNCCVGVYDKGRVNIIEDEQGNTTFPCMVTFFGRDVVVGEAAKDQFTSNIRNTVFDMKKLLGRGFRDGVVEIGKICWPFKVVCGMNDKPIVEMKFNGMERRFAPEEISAMVLRKIKTIAEGHLNSFVKNAVITVPAYFNNVQRQAVKEAATIAGLHVMQLMDEPTAALVAYGLDAATYNSSTPKKILIFDLGGHSLDISLLSVKNGLVQLQVLGGDENLGGRNFDSSLVDYCAEQLRLKHNRSIHNAEVALSNLRMECERAKIHLSSTKET